MFLFPLSRYLVEFVLPDDNVLPRDDVSLDSGFSDEEVEDMEGRIFMKNFSFLVWLDRRRTLGIFREPALFKHGLEHKQSRFA